MAWLDIGNLARYMVAVPIILFVLNRAVVLRPGLRLTRALFAVFCLFSSAIDISFGAINHSWQLWIWISVMMIFLPGHRGAQDSAHKLTVLSVMVYIQGMVLLFYSMAGSLKLMAGIKSLAAGEMGNFSALGFSSLLAGRMVQGSGVTVLGDYFITHPMFAYPFFLGLIVVQTLAFPAAFLPRLHRSLGLVLIGFHLGTGLLMDIYFPAHVLWLALFLVCSPFRVARPPWRGIPRGLPGKRWRPVKVLPWRRNYSNISRPKWRIKGHRFSADKEVVSTIFHRPVYLPASVVPAAGPPPGEPD